ncbi:hypothetical protein [Bacillus mycoides]|nr:hypothetical protein [Bacillus mycoides]MCQ6360566.1 hypothetical protein [Bacillus cereus]
MRLAFFAIYNRLQTEMFETNDDKRIFSALKMKINTTSVIRANCSYVL